MLTNATLPFLLILFLSLSLFLSHLKICEIVVLPFVAISQVYFSAHSAHSVFFSSIQSSLIQSKGNFSTFGSRRNVEQICFAIHSGFHWISLPFFLVAKSAHWIDKKCFENIISELTTHHSPTSSSILSRYFLLWILSLFSHWILALFRCVLASL